MSSVLPTSTNTIFLVLSKTKNCRGQTLPLPPAQSNSLTDLWPWLRECIASIRVAPLRHLESPGR